MSRTCRLLEDGIEDLDVDQHGFGDHRCIGLSRQCASEGWHHDAAEILVGPRIVRDARAQEIVVGSSLQSVLVEIEHLLGRKVDEARRELRAKASPRLAVLLPRRQLLHHDVRTGEEERGRKIVPDLDAAEENQMQLVRERGLWKIEDFD